MALLSIVYKICIVTLTDKNILEGKDDCKFIANDVHSSYQLVLGSL